MRTTITHTRTADAARWTFAPSTYSPSAFRIFRTIPHHGTNRSKRLDDGNGGFSENDARLIAAAPELLEALKCAAWYWQLWIDGNPTQVGSTERDDFAATLAVISKATGSEVDA